MKHFALKAVSLGAAAVLALASSAISATPPDASKYPILDDKQLGQFNYIVKLSRQADNDWSNMQPADKIIADDHVRFQLAFMSYALAVTHYNYTPAYRELDEQTDNNLIRKMFLFDSWSDWEMVSQGIPKFDPDFVKLGARYDPAKDFIMYSGHLYQMLVTHAMLFNDRRYDKPNSIVFKYPASNVAAGGQTFSYDLSSLTDELMIEFRKNKWTGSECIPNAVFVMCNQHPILGFYLYDKAHGTQFFPTVETEYKKAMATHGFLDEKTKSWISFYRVKQNTTEPSQAAWGDAWTGAFMHGWDKQAAESVYPQQRDKFLVKVDDAATIKSEPNSGQYSQGHAFMAALAAEMGDEKTKNEMLRYADRYFQPKWQGNSYYYPIQASFKLNGDGPNVWRRVQPLASTAVLTLARLTPKDGIYNLFAKPFGSEHFKDPYISNVSYPHIQVPRAIFDEASKALVVTLRPGKADDSGTQAGSDSWKINNLASGRRWALWRDGVKIASIESNSVKPAKGATAAGLTAAGDSLTVNLPVTKETTFIVTEE